MKFNKISRKNNKFIPRKLNDHWKNFILFLVFISSLFFALWIWDKIFLPITKDNLNNYHTQTDTLRFIFFIFISIAPFLFFYLKFFSNKLNSLNTFLKIKLPSKHEILQSLHKSKINKNFLLCRQKSI